VQLRATTLYLVRHGQTAWNLEGRCQGHADIPLDATGIAQARSLAAALAGHRIDAIYTSDLARAHETARIVAAARSATAIARRALREIDIGSWSGLTDEEIEVRYPGFVRPDGETDEEHVARVAAAIAEIVAAHPGEHVLVVSHGQSLEAFRRHAGMRSRPLRNCEWFTLVARDGMYRE